MRLHALVILFSMVLFSGVQAVASTQVSVKELLYNDQLYGSRGIEGLIVLTNNDVLQELWRRLHQDDKIKAPVVDFEKNIVLAHFDGEKPSAAHSTRVSQIIDHNDHLEVIIVRKKRGGLAGMAVVKPSHLVQISEYHRVVPDGDWWETKPIRLTYKTE
ncbi:MAG: hypothetical protein AB1540_09620 [Bdellovibrionota bacterium]